MRKDEGASVIMRLHAASAFSFNVALWVIPHTLESVSPLLWHSLVHVANVKGNIKARKHLAEHHHLGQRTFG